MATPDSLDQIPTPDDSIGLLEGIATTRSIRRYADEPVPESVLRDICFAASRAPTGSNRQQFRMIVLTDGDIAQQAKHLIAEGAQRLWSAKRRNDGYDEGSGITDDSPKARMARSMETYVDGLSAVPALILPTLIRHREPTSTEGASVYPAMQNLLLAARGLGYGGVVTMWHAAVEPQLRALLQIPDDVFLAATVTLGKPAGNHGPVRRRPLDHALLLRRRHAGCRSRCHRRLVSQLLHRRHGARSEGGVRRCGATTTGGACGRGRRRRRSVFLLLLTFVPT